MENYSQVQLLAPAGSVTAMKAAISAGADAVYIGGRFFGARAYAENPDDMELCRAIRYVHIHGKKLYLTVNTLLKEDELEKALYPWLKPYYEEGLDAVIVQDLGVLRFIREFFPDLEIHASTQMAAMGQLCARQLEESGVSRLILPRELSLDEIEEIRRHSSIELEAFIHGALCYCYSGQCLFSSIAGGRSGNRGRCAGPCRLAYQLDKKEDQAFLYYLSLKDLNTLKILPEILRAGVTSLKIEGRMKKPEYTAGVVQIYRKYLDLINAYPAKAYSVAKEDEKALFDLFNRNGFSQGYYKTHNGRDMVTIKEPAMRKENEELLSVIRENHILKKRQEECKGKVMIEAGKPAVIDMETRDISLHICGDTVTEAKNRPLSESEILKQINKTGDAEFTWTDLEIVTDGKSFYPVGKLNELRRNAFSLMEKELCQPYLKTAPEFHENGIYGQYASGNKNNRSCGKTVWSAVCETVEQLQECLKTDWIDEIYLD
ncbi:MAG: U32 family peptidase, partial [Parasporobacterium sp.]|nr:U32 family peptidase [Parasporobacterium sp.]